jgi:hypothetical protein
MLYELKVPTKLGLALVGILVAMQFPQPAGAQQAGPSDSQWKAAATTCAANIGITLPDSPQAFHELAPEVKDNFHACMAAAGFQRPPHPHGPLSAAMVSCLTTAGFPPPSTADAPPPGPPSPELHAAFKQCRLQTQTTN